MDKILVLMYAIVVFDVVVFAIYFVKGRLAIQDKSYRFIALSAIFSSVVAVFRFLTTMRKNYGQKSLSCKILETV